MVVLRYIDAVAYSGLSMPPRRAGGLAVSATKFGDAPVSGTARLAGPPSRTTVT
jgi:hypothetical protein